MIDLPFLCFVIGSDHRITGLLWLKEIKMVARGASHRNWNVLLSWEAFANLGGVPGLCLRVRVDPSAAFCLEVERPPRAKEVFFHMNSF